jgi:hypothetical protein
VRAFLTCPMRATYPVNLTVLYFINLIMLGETVQIMKYIMMQILYAAVISLLLGRSILLTEV